MQHMMKRGGLALAVLLSGTSLAGAHPLEMHQAGALAGLEHPFLGIDHLLAMIAVGLWAIRQGGKAVYLLPLSFMGAMGAGGWLGMQGLLIPGVEAGIAASVFILGVLLTTLRTVPFSAGWVLTLLFALFHGNAHGAELPQAASALGYTLGFVGATGVLHGIGLLLGRWLMLAPLQASWKWLGRALMLAGAVLFGNGVLG